MSGRPVNIAEFRCRAMRARTAEFSLRLAPRTTGLKIVASPSDHRSVFDIGMARDSQRFRRRPAIRPIAIQNGAKIIRFGDERRLAAVAMRAPQPFPRAAMVRSIFPPRHSLLHYPC